MSALYVILIVSLLVAAGFLIAFLWSVNKGQYDDDYTPSVRILFDEAPGGPATGREAGTTDSGTDEKTREET